MRDHARLCEGREYTCTCGYDQERSEAYDGLLQAAKEVYDWMNQLPIPTNGCVAKMQVLHDAIGKAEASPDHVVGSPIVSVKTMRLSDGRADYFVSIKVGNREVTPHLFREEYKAAYHVALYSWLLNGTDKPDLMAFDEDDWPAQATEHVVGSPALLDVAAERRRHVEVEGWSPAHDDQHTDFSLAKAAAIYTVGATLDGPDRAVMDTHGVSGTPGWMKDLWPWDISWWKPTGRRRDLVKAAALIIAEIERLDRTASLPKAKYLNLMDGKVYELVSTDGEVVTFTREGRETPHYLGKEEFDRRFQQQSPATPAIATEGGGFSMKDAVSRYLLRYPSARTSTILQLQKQAETTARLRQEIGMQAVLTKQGLTPQKHWWNRLLRALRGRYVSAGDM